MRRYSRNLRMSIAIVAAALVFGICLIVAAKIISSARGPLNPEAITAELKELKKRINNIENKISKAGVAPERIEPPKPGSKKVEGVDTGNSPVKGNSGAPVLLVEFSDFQCPFSKRFYQETFPQIEKEYILTGKVKFAYRDFPLPFHPMAEPAAAAARCAARQNKYWEMFNKLAGNDSLDDKTIKRNAQEVGLKVKDFDACLKSPEIKEEIKKELSAAQKFGVSGTPAFFINGRLIVGAYPFEAFKQIIDEELNKAAGKK